MQGIDEQQKTKTLWYVCTKCRKAGIYHMFPNGDTTLYRGDRAQHLKHIASGFHSEGEAMMYLELDDRLGDADRIIEAKNDQLTAYEQLIAAALVIARDGGQSNVPGRMRLALDQVVELLSGGEVSK